MTDLKLSAAQSEVYRFITEYQIRNDGRTPSQEEIAAGLGKGRSTIRFHLNRLIKKGYITNPSGSHRALNVAIK